MLLLWTIWQGREALALQKDETRPWLSFKNLKVRSLNIHKLESDGGWLIFAIVEVQIVNSGGMPAGEVRVFAQAISNPASAQSPAEVERLIQSQIPTNRGLAMGIVPPDGIAEFKSPAAPFDLPATDEQGASLRDVWPGILLSVMYRTIGSDDVHQTAQVFRLSYGDPAQHTDDHTATGFWLAHKTYGSAAITITAGSKMDRAT